MILMVETSDTASVPNNPTYLTDTFSSGQHDKGYGVQALAFRQRGFKVTILPGNKLDRRFDLEENPKP